MNESLPIVRTVYSNRLLQLDNTAVTAASMVIECNIGDKFYINAYKQGDVQPNDNSTIKFLNVKNINEVNYKLLRTCSPIILSQTSSSWSISKIWYPLTIATVHNNIISLSKRLKDYIYVATTDRYIPEIYQLTAFMLLLDNNPTTTKKINYDIGVTAVNTNQLFYYITFNIHTRGDYVSQP